MPYIYLNNIYSYLIKCVGKRFEKDDLEFVKQKLFKASNKIEKMQNLIIEDLEKE
jgi:hypothetical protein